MKMTKLFAAVGLTVAAMSMSGAAQAHDRWGDDGWRHERRWDDDRRWSENRRWDNDWRWDHDRRWDRDRRWAHDRRWKRDRRWDRRYDRDRVHCWTEWYDYRRVRVCR